MGQSALILTLAATLTIIVILIVVGQTSRDADNELAQYQYKVLAREVSSTGLNMTVRRLVDEPYQWSTASYGYTDTPHRGGTFTTTVTPIGMIVPNFYGVDQDTVDVVSIGTIPTSGGDTTHVIEARYVKGYEDFGLPPGLKKAIFAEETLALNGGADIMSADPSLNVEIHADGELKASGGPVNVFGYGTVGDGSDGDDPAAYDHIRPNAESIFDPNFPEEDRELVHPDAPIFLPLFDANSMLLDADVIVNGSGPQNNYVLSGDTLTLSDYPPGTGTYDNPLVYYVAGNLVIGNMIIEGNVQFVVEGNITFNGSVTVYADGDGNGLPDPEPADTESQAWEDWMQGQLDAAGNTTIGYFSEGEVTANGNFTLTGQIYANQDVTLNGGGNGEVNIIGGIVSTRADVTTNGDVNVRFAALSGSTLIPGLHYIVPEGVRLIAYAEW